MPPRIRSDRKQSKRVASGQIAPPPSAWNSERWLFLAILALAAFLRFFEITSVPPPLNFDEAMNGNDAMVNLETGRFDVFYPENGGREGLYINCETLLLGLFGHHAWLLRLPAAIWGTLTVAGLYLLARKLFGRWEAAAAAFFYAASFWHVLFSRLGLRAVGAPFFLVWAAWLLTEGLSRAIERRPAWRWMAAAGVVYGCGFYTYLAYRVTPLLAGAVIGAAWWAARQRGSGKAVIRASALWLAATAAAVAPLVLYFARHPEQLTHHTSELSVFADPNPLAEILSNLGSTAAMLFFRGDGGWLYNIPGRPALAWPLAAILVVGLWQVWRLARAHQAQAVAAVFLAGWAVLAALPAVFSNQGMPSAIRSILILPPVCMLGALGAAALFEELSRRAGKQAAGWACAAVACFLAWDCYQSYFGVWAANPETAKVFDQASVEIADRILAMPESAPKFVIPVAPGIPGGMPAPAQTVMFLTQSYTQSQRARTNIHYITRDRADLPDGVDFCQMIAREQTQGAVFCLIARAVGIKK